jgi:hypothetical protein
MHVASDTYICSNSASETRQDTEYKHQQHHLTIIPCSDVRRRCILSYTCKALTIHCKVGSAHKGLRSIMFGLSQLLKPLSTRFPLPVRFLHAATHHQHTSSQLCVLAVVVLLQSDAHDTMIASFAVLSCHCKHQHQQRLHSTATALAARTACEVSKCSSPYAQCV